MGQKSIAYTNVCRSRCHECHAEVLWVHSADDGELVPLGAAPSADGTHIVEDLGGNVLLRARRLSSLERALDDRPRYTLHRATCTAEFPRLPCVPGRRKR